MLASEAFEKFGIFTTKQEQIAKLEQLFSYFLGFLKGVLNNFYHFGSARLFLFIFAYYIKHLLIYDIW